MFEKDDLIMLKKGDLVRVYDVLLNRLISNHPKTIGKIIGFKTINSNEFYIVKFACYKGTYLFYKPIINSCFEKIKDDKSYNIY